MEEFSGTGGLLQEPALRSFGKQLAFVDVEASGLTEDSFPIEVGWAILGGSSGSVLIRPAADWSHDAWDELAEDQHGITWTKLNEEGVSPEDAAQQLNQILPAGTLALSDAFEWDGFWIERLFDVSSQVKRLQVGDYWRSLSMVAPSRAVASARRSDADTPRAHNARKDAEHLRTLWGHATSLTL